MSTAQIMAALRAPFHPAVVKWRLAEFDTKSRKGRALAYVDARDVAERFDDVMGADWSNEFVPMPNGTSCCKITLHLADGTRTRSNGAGDTDKEAAKGGYSDAFKRAAVMWGVGAYLYALRPQVVDVEFVNGRPTIAPHERARLQGVLGAVDPGEPADSTAATPPEIKPDDSAAIQNVVRLALEFCDSEATLQDWARQVGHRSDKWHLMLPEHRTQIAALAKTKLAEVRAKDAEHRRLMAQTITGEREPGEDEPDQAEAA